MLETHNAKATREFFGTWDNYHQLINTLDSYTFTKAALRYCMEGRVLDIGNGGVFNYDLEAPKEVVALDLVDFSHLSDSLPEKVSFKTGDATFLPFPDKRFDRVLVQMLIHHLAEESFDQTEKRVDSLINEAHRVLDSGGKFIIIESFMPTVLVFLEQILYPLFRLFLRKIDHPLVFQWNLEAILSKLQKAEFHTIELEPIPQGRWMILLGRKWPTLLSPLKNYRIIATKA